MTNKELIALSKSAMQEILNQSGGSILEHEQTAYNCLRLLCERIPTEPDCQYCTGSGTTHAKTCTGCNGTGVEVEDEKECSVNCGMNYCDENGCTNRRRVLVNPCEPNTHIR